MEAFLTIAERLGFPAAVLIFFALAVWIVVKWFGKNVILPITTKHIELIDEAKATNKVNAETLGKMAATAQVTGESIVRIADQHEEQVQLTREIHQRIVKDTNSAIRAENVQIRAENAQILAHQQQGDQK